MYFSSVIYHDFFNFCRSRPIHHFNMTPQNPSEISENDLCTLPAAILCSFVISPHDWILQHRCNFSNHPFTVLFPFSNRPLSSLWSKSPLTRAVSPLVVWSPFMLSSPRLSFTLSVASLTKHYTRCPSHTRVRRPHSKPPLPRFLKVFLASQFHTDVRLLLAIGTPFIRFL